MNHIGLPDTENILHGLTRYLNVPYKNAQTRTLVAMATEGKI